MLSSNKEMLNTLVAKYKLEQTLVNRNAIIEAFYDYMVKVLKSIGYKTQTDFAEYVAEATVIVIEAIDDYIPGKCSFKTFASNRISQRLVDNWRKANPSYRTNKLRVLAGKAEHQWNVLSIDNLIRKGEHSEAFDTPVRNEMNKTDWNDFMDKLLSDCSLTPQRSQVLRMLYVDDMSIPGIAKKLGLSKAVISHHKMCGERTIAKIPLLLETYPGKIRSRLEGDTRYLTTARRSLTAEEHQTKAAQNKTILETCDKVDGATVLQCSIACNYVCPSGALYRMRQLVATGKLRMQVVDKKRIYFKIKEGV